MRKAISLLLIITTIFPIFSVKTYSEDINDGYFIVTAYYSPLPNQEHYLTGDYNSELKLNGNGIRGASGKDVFSGMLAAPKNYDFGTKIYLDGLGIGEVSDRGGAIVNAGKRGYEHDRIDVWMGYGDEGLKRAMYWGKRKIKGYVTDYSLNTTFDYKKILAPDWATNGLRSVPSIFNTGIGRGSDANLVSKLQKLLSEVGLYKGAINGDYNSEVIDIIYRFQLDNEIVKKESDYGAGYWGNKTRSLFLKEYLDGDFDKNKYVVKKVEEQKIVETPVKKEEVKVVEKTVVVEEKKAVILSTIFDRAISGKKDVQELQSILKELGYYKGEITGNEKDLIDPVFDYQVAKKIVSGLGAVGAGVYGPKTRAALKSTYSEYLATKETEAKEKARIEAEKQKEIERKKDLEERYKKLDELSLKKAEEKIASIGTPKFGEIGTNVRALQVALKDLGYFKDKDTAIFGNITKDSIFSYQVSKSLVSKNDDLGAGMIGPRTLNTIKMDFKNMYLNEMIKQEGLDLQQLANIVGYKM